MRWLMTSTIAAIGGPTFTPLLASWERASDPAQIRLRRYLDGVSEAVGASIVGSELGLRLHVDVVEPERLLQHYDLENYLTPLVRRLGAGHFRLVEASKRVGGGSRLLIDNTARDGGVLTGDWQRLQCQAGSGADGRVWKARLREALQAADATQLPPGPVAMEVAWTASSRRNWLTLWKPTLDAMGPVLGEPDSRNPFNPADDRITSLRLHHTIDDANGWNIHIDASWRAA